jgi:hypothetical protein
MEDDGEVLRHLAASSAGDKIKPLLPSSLRKAMEQKAREYKARPNIRSYSRTIYNMAEIGKNYSVLRKRLPSSILFEANQYLL